MAGTDSDALGDFGTWSYSLAVGAVSIMQTTPVFGSVSTSASTGFRAQLFTSGNAEAVTFHHGLAERTPSSEPGARARSPP